MNLGIFNNLINATKENVLVEKFIDELNNFLENKNSTANTNEISLLQQLDNEGKVMVSYRDKMLIERANILNRYARETQEKGTIYFVYNKDIEENVYHISICEEGKSSVVIEARKNELPKGTTVDSVLRKINGKYVLDKEATETINEAMIKMTKELLNEQTQALKEWRKEGHLYTVVENTGDKVWLLDTTIDNKNGICIDDINFPKELMEVAKEGTIFKYVNGEYVK